MVSLLAGKNLVGCKRAKCTNEVIHRAGLTDNKISDTLIELNVKLNTTDDVSLEGPILYRELVGCLDYLTVTSLNLAYAVYGYFESLLREVEEETEREISEAVEKAVSGSQKLQKMQSKLDKCVKEKKFLDEINENLLKNQTIWKAKMVEIEASKREEIVFQNTLWPTFVV
ncbi:hypothetical protein CsSME_00007414 [Camellia sinensis var. sinensis]